MKKKYTLLLIYTFSHLFICSSVFSQNLTVDSLELALKKTTQDTTRLRLRNDIGEVAAIFRVSYWDSLAKDANRLQMKKIEAKAYNNIGFIYYNKGVIDKALTNFRKSLQLEEELNDKEGLASTLNNMGALYENQGDISMAINFYQKSLNILEELDDKKGIANLYNNIGLVFNNQADIKKALECFNQSLKIYEEIEDKKGVANALNSIGLIYNGQGDMSKALEYFNKSLKLYEETSHKKGIALVLTNIGTCYKNTKQLKKALEYYNKSLQIKNELGDKREIAITLSAIGSINFEEDNPLASLIFFEKSLAIERETEDLRGMAGTLNCIGASYFRLFSLAENTIEKQHNYKLAEIYADSSLSISKKLGIADCLFRAERLQSKIDSAKGNYMGAFEHYKQFIFYRDSITNEATRKASVKNQIKYEFEKKEAVLKEQQEKERSVAEEKNRFQQIIIWSVVLGLLLVIVFAGFVVRSLRTARLQKRIIEEKQREILDSIHYAKRIQKSLLPTEKYIDKSLQRLKE